MAHAITRSRVPTNAKNVGAAANPPRTVPIASLDAVPSIADAIHIDNAMAHRHRRCLALAIELLGTRCRNRATPKVARGQL